MTSKSLEQRTLKQLQPRMEYAIKKRHDPALIFVDWTKVGSRGISACVCKTCRQHIGMIGRNHAHNECKGEKADTTQASYAPGLRFWQALKASNSVDQAQKALEIEDEEMQNIMEAVAAALERQVARVEKLERQKENGMTHTEDETGIGVSHRDASGNSEVEPRGIPAGSSSPKERDLSQVEG